MLPSPSRRRPLDAPFNTGPRAQEMIPREPRVAILLNANAKRVNSRVRDAFARIAPEDDLFFSRSLDEAKTFVRTILERRYATLMLGGGDGTIAATLDLLVKAADEFRRSDQNHSLPNVAVLRLGTGNGLGYLSGAGKPLEDAMRMLSGEQPEVQSLRLIRDVESGSITPFGSMGYDAQVLNDHVDVVNQTKSTVGRAFAKSLGGYFYALGTRTVLSELRGPRASVTVTARGRASVIDPETDEEVPLEANTVLFEGSARAVSFGTSPFYGFGLRALPFARRRSDRFHVRVSNASVAFLLTNLSQLWKGTLRTPDFVDFLVEGVDVESTHPLPTQMAGDASGHQQRLSLELSPCTFGLVSGTASRG